MVDSIGGWRRTGRVFASVAVWSVAACRDGAKLGVGVQPLRAPLNTATVRYRIEAGVRTWAVTLPPKTDSRGRDERRDSDEFDTPRTGAARVSFTLVLPDGRQISSGEVTPVTISSATARTRTRIPALQPLAHELVARHGLALGVMSAHMRDVAIVIRRSDDRADDACRPPHPAQGGPHGVRASHARDAA